MKNKLSAGDSVWASRYGAGKVLCVEGGDHPIRVRFDTGRTVRFAFDGKEDLTDLCPSLFLGEVKVARRLFLTLAKQNKRR